MEVSLVDLKYTNKGYGNLSLQFVKGPKIANRHILRPRKKKDKKTFWFTVLYDAIFTAVTRDTAI